MDNDANPFEIKPTPKQIEFITSPSKFTCFSGGFGSGKTFAGCVRALYLSQYPGNVGLIGRLTYPTLRNTTRKTFFEVCPPEFYDERQGGRWSPTENHLRLTNGSEILFMHMDTMSEKELLSLNIGWFFVDQAEEISLNVFRILQSRLRLARVPNRFGFISCNPEPGSWIYDQFKKPTLEGKPRKGYHIIDSMTYDNPHLPPDYIESLLADYPEDMRKRYIEGSWDVMQDQIYPEFNTRIHVVRPFKIPEGWEILVSLDHGMVNPTAVLWAAIDFDYNVYIFDEYYNPGIVSQHAKEILAKSQGLEVAGWYIDPATQAKTKEKDGMPWSILEEYEDYGLYFIPANNEKLGGINRVKEFLKPHPARKHPVTNERPAPRLYVFQNCVNLIQELRQYKWKKYRGGGNRNDPEQAVDYADHAVDALRYLVMTRFPAPNRRPIGSQMLTSEHRRNMNDMASDLPSSHVGDDELGSFYADSVTPITNLSQDDG